MHEFHLPAIELRTGIPAFIGYTGKLVQADFMPGTIRSFAEYEREFGQCLTLEIRVDFLEGAAKAVWVAQKRAGQAMREAVRNFFANGGQSVYVVPVDDGYDAVDVRSLLRGLESLDALEDVSLLLFPDAWLLNDPSEYYGIYNQVLEHCKQQQCRMVLLDVWRSAGDDWLADLRQLYTHITDNPVLLRYGAAYLPRLRCPIPAAYIDEARIEVHGADAGTLQQLKTLNPGQHAAAMQALSGLTWLQPASPSVAGLVMQHDATQGIWKAPAGITLSALTQPEVAITDRDQHALAGINSGNKTVNVIRSFPGRGTLVWGARTLAGNDNEWRYIPVVRFCMAVESSLWQGLAPFAFEPNDVNTWKLAQQMTEGFLHTLWRQGALVGNKPDEAYFVRVGLGNTMTPGDVLSGRMITELGLAILKPGEFIVLRITQQLES